MSASEPPVLDGKYEILGRIREGGMGAIYKVRHRLLDEIRVVKVIRPKIASDEEMRNRFLREARLATRLKHANVLTFHDFALGADGTAYMVLEYIDGVNLGEMLRTSGVPPFPLALSIGHQLLAALAYLHGKGIVHRDISPDNAMVFQEGDEIRLKLIDLGIARSLGGEDQLTVEGVFVGKLRYSPPERFAGSKPGPADVRSDLYSVGCVFYEVLTGVSPFAREDAASMVHAHIAGKPTPFEESDPSGRVPPPLRELLLKALAPRVEDRPQTAAAMLEPLAKIERDRGLPAGAAEARRYFAAALAARPVEATARAGSDSARDLAGLGFASGGAWPTGDAPSLPGSTSPTREVERPTTATGVLAPDVPLPHGGGSPQQTLPPPVPPPRPRPLPQEPEPAPSPGAGSRTRGGPSAVVVAATAALVLFSFAAGIFALRERLGLVSRPTAGAKEAEPLATAPATAAATAVAAPTAVPAAAPVATPPALATETPASAPAALPTAAAASVPISPPPPMPRARPASPAEAVKVAAAVPGASAPTAPRRPEDAGTGTPSRSGAIFCILVEKTSFEQGVTRGTPEGFAPGPEAFRAARPDAGRVRIEVAVLPQHPKEGEPFEIVARLVNGGDLSMRIDRVEELVLQPRPGFTGVEGMRLPADLDVGGSLEIYRFRGVLTGGRTYQKELRVVDSVKDSWRTAVRLVPCSD